jgi:hypothetical protein
VITDEFGFRSDKLEHFGKLDADIMTIGQNVEHIVLGTDLDYTITFEVVDGFALDFTVGDGTTPTQAVRYWDVEIPAGTQALLESPKDGIGLTWLRYDGDGDGVYETVVSPTAEVTGDAAHDTEPPRISVSTTLRPSALLVTITAEDPSGVQAIHYSLDDEEYQPYTAPFEVNPAEYPTVYVFADDTVANRSSVIEFELRDSKPAELPVPKER